MAETNKNNTNTEKTKATVEATAAATAIAPKKRISQEEALSLAARLGKSFKLMRSIYTNNGKNYYAYSVFLVLDGNKQSFVEVSLIPNIGFVKTDDNANRKSRNASSYSLLNFLYDNGQGLKLELRKRVVDKEKNTIVFDYYAVAEDESGITVESQLVPKTPGEEGYLKAAFAGFGRCRDFSEKDFETLPGLKEAFERILLPGETPEVDVEEI